MNVEYIVQWHGGSWRDIPQPTHLQRKTVGQSRFHYIGPAKCEKRARVLEVLRTAPYPLTVRQIAAELHQKPGPIRSLVSRLVESGSVTSTQIPGVNGRSGRGAYEYQIAK